VDDCGLIAESRNVRKEKIPPSASFLAVAAQAIQTSARLTKHDETRPPLLPFPLKSTKPRCEFGFIPGISIQRFRQCLCPASCQKETHHSVTAASPEFAGGLRAGRPMKKAPGRLTAGALAAPFSPGGSIKAATQIIIGVRRNLTSNHRKGRAAIFAPWRRDFGQYRETIDDPAGIGDDLTISTAA
jgi:hypothetical protein